jgi:leucyl aminopeptidase
MSESIKIDFAALATLKATGPLPGPAGGEGGKQGAAKSHAAKSEPAKSVKTVVVFAAKGLEFGAATKAFLGEDGETLLSKAAAATKFTGKFGAALDVIAPSGFSADRLLVVGVGASSKDAEASDATRQGKAFDVTNLGGVVAAKIGRGAHAVVVFDLPLDAGDSGVAVAEFTIGLRLRDYRFDLYKTKKKDEAEDNGATVVTIAVADHAKIKAAVAARAAVADGVLTARSLVNEPANILYPETFAHRAKALESLGVEVEILDVPAMEKLGMGALLGVSQGSSRPGRIVIMRWNGAGKSGNGEAHKPLAFIGKGVTFDTGGISIKPAGGMEDMKGDMAGAACVVGLMQALAGRKAKVDAIGAIGIVENMPGPDAQRPGDIVTSMSGQTIEIINTDAEGRLVLADVCWYVQQRYKPAFMIDLATLTGAIIVALGQEYAGLFSNDDALSEKILAAGQATGEKLWRMPLGAAYDKLIDSKFADVKNSGGRHASSITAAQFIQRFVNDTPWAHLDIAGMGMGSPSSDINQSWGSGWGVRLLDRLVADNYEPK